jgi:hypothetical protein
MGEYAKNSHGTRIKIGTCEDMYYLRFDQRYLVSHERGNVDPVKDAHELRFRFPWPDEDRNEPGAFDDFDRSFRVENFPASTDCEHYSVQFTAQNGYLVSLPCPESGEHFIIDSDGVKKPLQIHKNGYGGAVHLVRQKFRPGIGLVPILKCGGCRAMWREESLDRIELLAVCLRSEGDKRQADDERDRRRRNDDTPSQAGLWWHQIADRVLAGIADKVAV